MRSPSMPFVGRRIRQVVARAPAQSTSLLGLRMAVWRESMKCRSGRASDRMRSKRNDRNGAIVDGGSRTALCTKGKEN
jgi:hypothetical protein